MTLGAISARGLPGISPPDIYPPGVLNLNASLSKNIRFSAGTPQRSSIRKATLLCSHRSPRRHAYTLKIETSNMLANGRMPPDASIAWFSTSTPRGFIARTICIIFKLSNGRRETQTDASTGFRCDAESYVLGEKL